MKPVFLIDGVDFSWILGEGGLQISRNDIDTQKTTRSNVTGEMYRKRLAVKRKLNVSNCKRMTTAEIVMLNKALNKDTVAVTILDMLTGEENTFQFYGSSVESTVQIYDATAEETYWTNTAFSLIEV